MLPNVTQDGLLKVSGTDAKKLLQGQLTCNLDRVSVDTSCLGALCNQQGRVISLFRLIQHQDDYYLFMRRLMVPITLAALKKYAVFYKVELTDISDAIATLKNTLRLEKYADIKHRLPAIYPETSGKFLPHDINLLHHEAISLDKGCYTGQEIIARMHYKAKLKKHLYATSIQSTLPVLPGMDVYSEQDHVKQMIGTIADAEAIEDQRYLVLIVMDESEHNGSLDETLFVSSRSF